jgi:large conductance mechanosensitive channel
MLREFKAFINQGNAIDLAVGVVIGAAFGKIVNSLVNDIIMPVVGGLTGGIDFKDKFVTFGGGTYSSLEEARTAGAAVVAYGQFVNTIVEFLIVAFSIFLVVRQINRYRKPAAPPAA